VKRRFHFHLRIEAKKKNRLQKYFFPDNLSSNKYRLLRKVQFFLKKIVLCIIACKNVNPSVLNSSEKTSSIKKIVGEVRREQTLR